MTGRLEGRATLVTGAASGIGRATAHLCAAEGAPVLCADRDAAGAARVAGEIASAGGIACPALLDVASESDWAAAMTRTATELGPLRVLVNAAGISHAQPVDAIALADWHRVMRVNLDGAVIGTRDAVRVMAAHRLPSAIVNVTSVSGRVAAPGASAYCASKAALRMFTRVAALECRRAGLPIRISSVAPGGVKTPMWRSMPFFEELVARTGSEEAAYAALGTQPHARFAEPDEIARIVVFLASDEASFVTATEIVADHGDV